MVGFIDNEIEEEAFILSQTDSTSAAGWLHKSNFAEVEDEITQMTKAQQLATIIIRSKGCLYSRWLEGGDNTVADSLS
jgi:hypothetical protein